jgi:hypothetical protein
MSIERIFYCDGPDCERSVSEAAARAPGNLLTIEDGDQLHFCGWDCVLRYAAAKEPEQVISGPWADDD